MFIPGPLPCRPKRGPWSPTRRFACGPSWRSRRSACGGGPTGPSRRISASGRACRGAGPSARAGRSAPRCSAARSGRCGGFPPPSSRRIPSPPRRNCPSRGPLSRFCGRASEWCGFSGSSASGRRGPSSRCGGPGGRSGGLSWAQSGHAESARAAAVIRIGFGFIMRMFCGKGVAFAARGFTGINAALLSFCVGRICQSVQPRL